MSYKSRSNYKIGVCLRQCANRDIKCEDCIGFSEFKKIEEVVHEEQEIKQEG